MTTPPLPTPSMARGRFSDGSLAELLALALGRQLSGTLVLRCPAGRKGALLVQSGQVIKGHTEEPPAPCTSPALEEQLARQVSWLARLPLRTAFTFHPEQDLLQAQPPAQADPLALIWRALRDTEDTHPHQTTLLTALEGRKLRPHVSAAPERFGLSESEQMVVTALRTRPRSLGELLQAGLSDPDRVRRLVYALAFTHHLDLGQGHSPLDVVPAPSRAAAASQRGGGHGQAPLSQPPSRLDSRPPRALHRSELRSSSAPAPKTDRDVAPRSAGTRSSADAMAGSRPLLEAADTAFHAAQQRAARQDYAEAARLARQASEADPANAEYLALHAWLRAQLGELSSPSAAEHILAALDRAVLKQRTNPRIRFLRGQVLKRMGRDEDAFKDFRFVARSEPSHIDAAREVRLYQLRQHKAQTRSGVFARLFLR